MEILVISITFLCLIPKIKYPKLPTDYRPIDLFNLILKTINRIKRIILPNDLPLLNLSILKVII